MRHRVRTILTASLLAASVALGPVTSPAVAGDAIPMLPDLKMARFDGVRLQIVGEQRQLRFDTIVVNKGVGPLEVIGSRASDSDPMTVFQRVFDTQGGHTDTVTPATMFFAGDGHTHWHVKDFETYILRQGGTQVGQAIKSGYCFFDNVRYAPHLPGAPLMPVYDPETVCGHDDGNALVAQSGLSVGWGDLYVSTLPDQYIDITALKPGIYRLVGIADRDDQFAESNDDNNRTWVRLFIHKSWIETLSWSRQA